VISTDQGGGKRRSCHQPKIKFRISENQLIVRVLRILVWAVMDAASLREKAALCLRIAGGLSWNNPGRLELTDLAERLDRQAKDSEFQNLPAEADSRAAAGARR
jgi:hypothetical protein